MSDVSKRVIVMQPGPLHLFWTTGIFYLWALMDRFDLVLIVPENFRDSEPFCKVVDLPGVRHVEYLSDKGRLTRQFRWNGQFRKIIKKFRPSYLLFHNRSYVENQYLIHWARKLSPEAKRYYYQNGRVSLVSEDDFRVRRAAQIDDFVKKHPSFERHIKLAGHVIDFRNAVGFFVNYKVLPYLVTGTTFSPPINVNSGRIHYKSTHLMSSTENDYLLSYLDIEIDVYRAQGISNIIKIQHPLVNCGITVFDFLYGKAIQTNSILLLPSYGYTARMLESGWESARLADHLAGKWCEAIAMLLKKFPGYSVKLKLHPGSFSDPLWKNIIKSIRVGFPDITIIDPVQSAEWHVIQSKIIVGDVTTVLWWAAMFGTRVIVSLDIFGYPRGDELKKYKPLITVIDSLSDEFFEKITKATHPSNLFTNNRCISDVIL
jgi:hypothetical protein